MDQLIGTKPHHERWKQGELVAQKTPLQFKDIWAVGVRLQLSDRVRYLALFDLAIDSKLRLCELVN